MSNEKNVRYCESSLNDKRRVKNIKKDSASCHGNAVFED
jgi:hypothetical protein